MSEIPKDFKNYHAAHKAITKNEKKNATKDVSSMNRIELEEIKMGSGLPTAEQCQSSRSLSLPNERNTVQRSCSQCDYTSILGRYYRSW